MEGITILNEQAIMSRSPMSIILIIFSFFMLTVCIGLLVVDKKFGLKINRKNTVICICIVPFLFIISFVLPKVDTDRSRYSVVLNDNCSAKDFYTYYNIISRDGDLWIIEDKEYVEE